MSAAELTITLRYGDALLWAEQIHRDQRRKGKAVAYISHLILAHQGHLHLRLRLALGADAQRQ